MEYSYETDSQSSDVIKYDDLDLTGVVINSKYAMLSKIGYGAFSTVWLAYNISNTKFRAIKVQMADDFDTGQSEVNILKTISRKKSEYINNLIDSFIYNSHKGKHVCMVSELMAGSVHDLIKDGKYSNGLPTGMVKEITRQILIGMKLLNEELNMIHADIKPENILIVGVSDKVSAFINEFKSLYKQHINSNNHKNRRSNRHNRHHIHKKRQHTHEKKKLIIQTLNKMKIKLQIERDIKYDSDNSANISNNINDKNDKDFTTINKKFLENIRIKISDFGSSCKITKNIDNEIQTRYYMAPELILKYPFNETCDMWSLGCMVYELLTGNILFDPIKEKRFDRDRNHIKDIQSILGPFPNSLLEKSANKNVYFTNNGLIKGASFSQSTIHHKSLLNKIKLQTVCGEEKQLMISDFIYNVLEYDPLVRMNPNNCLKLKWMTS
jgi:serine/threonine-protein kinase SRPK3